ncbi:MAG: cell division protein ZapB [Candidatus Krumholzibacteriia bacterium]
MDDHLSRLETKVHETIERLQTLRRENAALEQRAADLEQSVNDLRQERDRLQTRLAETSAAAAQIEEYEEKRRIIEQKVGSLLEKLEAMG